MRLFLWSYYTITLVVISARRFLVPFGTISPFIALSEMWLRHSQRCYIYTEVALCMECLDIVVDLKTTDILKTHKMSINLDWTWQKLAEAIMRMRLPCLSYHVSSDCRAYAGQVPWMWQHGVTHRNTVTLTLTMKLFIDPILLIKSLTAS